MYSQFLRKGLTSPSREKVIREKTKSTLILYPSFLSASRKKASRLVGLTSSADMKAIGKQHNP